MSLSSLSRVRTYVLQPTCRLLNLSSVITPRFIKDQSFKNAKWHNPPKLMIASANYI